SSVMWHGRDGNDVLFSTLEGRRKHRNMVRDPRVSMSIWDAEDPYMYVELRGRVTITEDVGREFDIGLSWRYDGREPVPDPPGGVRLIGRLEVEKATGCAAGGAERRIVVAAGQGPPSAIGAAGGPAARLIVVVDLAPARREHVPLGAELVEVLAVDVA